MYVCLYTLRTNCTARRRVPCIFGIIIVRQPGRCVAVRHDSIRDLKYFRTLGYTHIWITKACLSAARVVVATEYVYVFWTCLFYVRCNGALFCWAHVSGIACEKEINNLQHRILVGLVSAHCLARRGFIYLVYGVEVQQRTLAPNISFGCNKLPAAHACGQESRHVALPVAYIKEPSLYGEGGSTHPRVHAAETLPNPLAHAYTPRPCRPSRREAARRAASTKHQPNIATHTPATPAVRPFQRLCCSPPSPSPQLRLCRPCQPSRFLVSNQSRCEYYNMARGIGSFDLLPCEGQRLDNIRSLAARGRCQVC
jgi:hypothetical protein